MSAYTIDQWLLFFFFYCLCGWVWESCYVSARQRRWVNRGFLHGPLLPIYGSGALIILLATLPVRGSLPLIYLFGMIAATALEYVTGAAMEGLFKVRYWDYSNQRFNLRGYICLSSSLAWGVFSILLVRLIHPPIERLVLKIPMAWTEPLTLVLVAAVTVDTVQSVRAALDLREMLTKLTEENEDLRRLAKRAEVISTFAEEDLRRFRERTEVGRILLADRLELERQRAQEARADRALKRSGRIEESLRRGTAARVKALEAVSAALESCRDRLEDTLSGEALDSARAEIGEALEKLRSLRERAGERGARAYGRSLRILRGNPSATAKKYAEALEDLRSAGGLKRP